MCKYKHYIITKEGSIISKKTGKQLYVHVNKKGYNFVRLHEGGKGATYLVHRLIAELFVENPEGKLEVNHNDGNKSNNNYWNLEWCTRKENVDHSVDTGLHHKGESSGQAKLSNEQAHEIRKLCQDGMLQRVAGELYGISQARVSNIVHFKSYN